MQGMRDEDWFREVGVLDIFLYLFLGGYKDESW